MSSSGLFGALAPDLLYVGVYGPGYGESIIIRVPGESEGDDKWIVIDGCLIGDQSPAASILAHHDAEGADCLILTHAHLDHAKGLTSVIELGGNGILACADLKTPASRAVVTSRDGTGRQETKIVQHLLATIVSTWDRQPERKWLMRRGDTKQIGAATLEVLHPDDNTVAAYSGVPGHVNRLSTAIRLQWKGLTLLLGGDVLAEDWEEISREYGGQHRHACLKVPHHGSRGALHDCFGKVDPEQPLWIVAPWAGKAGGLPKFVEDQGMDWLLERNPEIHLTGLPLKADLQADQPYRVTAEDLRSGKRPPLCGEVLPDAGYRAQLSDQPEVNSCWVTAAFDADGNLVLPVEHGPGSLVVTRS